MFFGRRLVFLRDLCYIRNMETMEYGKYKELSQDERTMLEYQRHNAISDIERNVAMLVERSNKRAGGKEMMRTVGVVIGLIFSATAAIASIFN
jgi:hypothetical protein